jgi:mRNA interferase MazF
MVIRRSLKRGEIWLVRLDPTVGSEIRKTRPCVVISPPEIHDYLRAAIIAPLTSQGFPTPFRIPVRHARKNRLILLDQIRTVDKARLVKRTGSLAPAALSAVLSALVELFTQ